MYHAGYRTYTASHSHGGYPLTSTQVTTQVVTVAPQPQPVAAQPQPFSPVSVGHRRRKTPTGPENAQYMRPAPPLSPPPIVAQARVVPPSPVVSALFTTAGTAPAPVVASSVAKKAPTEEFPRSINVNGISVSVDGQLGKGSFGVVYKGKASVSGTSTGVAIKEIKCKTAAERTQAEYEAKLLRLLKEGGDPLAETQAKGARKSSSSLGRCGCPLLHANDTQIAGPQRWIVRIVMDRISGVPIDEFTKDAGNKVGHNEAMRLAQDLLGQMCPTMERVSALCIHRDVNAHNILITTAGPAPSDGSSRSGSSCSGEFTLIDFGLATDAKAWYGGEWKVKDIGGDCRYWPVSCWMQFLYGHKYLTANPDQAHEYMYNLDAHSLALTCLQLLSQASKGPKPAHAAGVYAAFAAYWEDAMKFHEELYAVFQGRGTWAGLKKSFLQQQIAEKTQRNLEKVKGALDECARKEEAAGAAFCRCLRKMLSGSKVSWTELQRMLVVRESFSQKVSESPVSKAADAAAAAWASAGEPNGSVEAPSSRQLASDVARSPSPSAVVLRARRYSHRRQRTSDGSSTSMAWSVPEVSGLRFSRIGGPAQRRASSKEKPKPPGIVIPEAEDEGQASPKPKSPVSPVNKYQHRRVHSIGHPIRPVLSDPSMCSESDDGEGDPELLMERAIAGGNPLQQIAENAGDEASAEQ